MSKYKIINIHGHLHQNDHLEQLVKIWKKDGVIKFCVLALGKQLAKHGYFTNRDVLKTMKEYPDIVVGMGHIELGPALDKVAKIEQLKEQGFSGLKFISPVAPYSDERYFPYYEKAVKLNMPIVFHVGWMAASEDDRQFGVNSEWMRPYTLDRVARSFPKLKIVLAHPGKPHGEEGLYLCTSFPNVYLCPSGAAGSDFYIARLKKLLAPFPGADWNNPDENCAKIFFRKFVFGTDNPPVSLWYSQAVKLMDYLHIEDKTRQLFFWKNAADIFGWKF